MRHRPGARLFAGSDRGGRVRRRHLRNSLIISSLDYRPPAPQTFIPHNKGLPWVSAPSMEGTRSPITAAVASSTNVTRDHPTGVGRIF